MFKHLARPTAAFLAYNLYAIFLISAFQKDPKEAAYVNAFKKYYNEKQKLLGKSLKDTVTIVRGLEGVKAGYTPNAKNIVITLSNNQVFIADFTTQLAIFSDKKDVVLCGWQNTTTIDNIDQEYLNQLQFTFPHQYNISNINQFDVLKEELEIVKPIIENRMKNAIPSLTVPMEVGMGIGKNWLEAH